jgi:hypothetical protein
VAASTSDWIYMVEWHVFDGTTDYLMRYAKTAFRFPTESLAVPPDWGWDPPPLPNIAGNSTYQDLVVLDRVKSITINSTMFQGGGTRGGIPLETGNVVFDNADGKLNRLPYYKCDGREVRIIRVNPANLRDFDTIWFGTATRYEVSGDTVVMHLRGWAHLLDRPMLVNKYAGTGNLEGSADDLKGKPKPWLTGKRFNVVPVRVHGAKIIYQWDGQIGTFYAGYSIAIYDKRAAPALTSGGTYANTTDLLNDALAPAPGQYKFFPGPGGVYSRLGSEPVGVVSGDVSNPMILYFGYSPTIVFDTASYASFVEAEMLVGVVLKWWAEQELAALNATGLQVTPADKFLNPGQSDAGLYLTEETTYLEQLNLLLQSCAGALFANHYQSILYTIRFALGQLETHSGETLTIREHDVHKGTLSVGAPSDPEAGIPFKKITANYKRNGFVMNQNDLDGTVSAADRVILAQEWRTETKTAAAAVTASYLSATTLLLDTALYDSAAALDLVEDALYPIYDVEGQVVTLAIDGWMFDDFVHDSTRTAPGVIYGKRTKVNVTHRDNGLSAGADCWLLGYQRVIGDSDVARLTLLPTAQIVGTVAPPQ